MKNKILVIIFIIYISVFSILGIIIPDKEISNSERRKLQLLPKLTVSNILDTSYMKDLDNYTVDQFVFRDEFRTIKANINYNILKGRNYPRRLALAPPHSTTVKPFLSVVVSSCSGISTYSSLGQKAMNTRRTVSGSGVTERTALSV